MQALRDIRDRLPCRAFRHAGHRFAVTLLPLLCGLTFITGCQNNPFASKQPAAGAGTSAVPAPANYTAQLDELRRRVSQLDAANRTLNAKLAQAEQNRTLSAEQVALLQSQLKQTAARLKQVELARQEAEKRITTFQASMRKRGGATLKPNNSLVRAIEPVDLPGLDVRQDGDLIRIEIPSDQLFRQGTAQMLGSGTQLLSQVATAIAAHYPRQRIAIEAHSDNNPAAPAVSTPAHLLTAQQAVAVLDTLTRRYRLPAQQLFVMAMGANHPKASNATAAGRAANRRVEIVIYPESF